MRMHNAPFMIHCRHEWRTQMRHPAAWGLPLLFIIMMVMLLPYMFPNALIHNSFIIPSALWMSYTLSCFMGFNTLFVQDYEQGVITQWVCLSNNLYPIVLARLLMHWIFYAVPAMLVMGVLGIMMGLSLPAVGVLCLTFFLGTPVIQVIGGLICALLLNLKQQAMLLPLLLLPLMLPVILFSINAAYSYLHHMIYLPQLAMLTALWVISITCGPYGVMLSLQIGVEQ